MQFTVILTKQPDAPWRARVPLLPGCEAEGETREETLAAIKKRVNTTTQHIEVIQIEAPPSISLNGETSEQTFAETWSGFGSHPDDPNWGAFFEELDSQRQ